MYDLGEFQVFRELRADKGQALKVLEEAAEAFEAANAYAKVAYRLGEGGDVPITRRRMLAECADVAQSLANLLVAWNVGPVEWAEAVGECTERNAARGRY